MYNKFRKSLDIYYIIDTGAQMQGDNMGSVNSAMEEAITLDLPDISVAHKDIDIRVAIMQFSNGASWVTPAGPVSMGDVIWNDLHAFGANDFGSALNLLATHFHRVDTSTSLSPIVIAFSNAPVTDDFESALDKLNQSALFQESIRIGIAIGEEADRHALTLFTGNSANVLAVNNKHRLKALMRIQQRKTRKNQMIDLKSILKQHPNCLNSRASFKSVLMDKYPTEKRMVNILTILFECGIATKIKTKTSIDSKEMQGFITQVENEYGISGQYSQEAILIWAAAFDVTAFAIKTQSPVTSPKEQATQVEQKPVVYVQGDVDDYNVVRRSDGYYITRFNGFEEDSMTIPSIIDGDKIKGIASEAFNGCVSVKHINISEGIEIIENSAFKGCTSLESISLPSTLCKIGNPTTTHGDGAFASTKLKTVIIPQNVDYIGPYTFYFCSNLTHITLPDNIKQISENTFCYCKKLVNITLPKYLEEIEKEAFDHCEGLRVVHIPMGTKVIHYNAFYGCSLSELYIPPTVKTIGDEKKNSYSYQDETLGSWLYRNKLTIYCTAGSTAMEYARKHNIKCAKAQF